MNKLDENAKEVKLKQAKGLTKQEGERIELNWGVLKTLASLRSTLAYVEWHMGISHDVIERRIREKHDMTYRQYVDVVSEGLGNKFVQIATQMAMGEFEHEEFNSKTGKLIKVKGKPSEQILKKMLTSFKGKDFNDSLTLSGKIEVDLNGAIAAEVYKREHGDEE